MHVNEPWSLTLLFVYKRKQEGKQKDLHASPNLIVPGKENPRRKKSQFSNPFQSSVTDLIDITQIRVVTDYTEGNILTKNRNRDDTDRSGPFKEILNRSNRHTYFQ